MSLHKAWHDIPGTSTEIKTEKQGPIIRPMQYNPCFNPAQKTAVISLHYFDLYTAHNISHLFTEAIVSDNYSFQQYKHHVGQ